MIGLPLTYPASYKNCGTCVVLPEPVSPHIKITSLLFTASNMFPSSDKIGSSSLPF